jgi:uncharacterized RDD family membrane protein YckC
MSTTNPVNPTDTGEPTQPAHPPLNAAVQTYTPATPAVAASVGAHAPIASVGRLIGAWLLELVLMTVTLGIGWLIWACITAAEGRTPAKKLMGLQAVNAVTGQPMSWGSYVFMRGLVGGMVQSFAGGLTLGVLHLMPLWDARNQSIAAKVSNSVVVDRSA